MKHLTDDELTELTKSMATAALDKLPDDLDGCCTDTAVLTLSAALLSAAIIRRGNPIETMRVFTGMLNAAHGRTVVGGVAVIQGGGAARRTASYIEGELMGRVTRRTDAGAATAVPV